MVAVGVHLLPILQNPRTLFNQKESAVLRESMRKEWALEPTSAFFNSCTMHIFYFLYCPSWHCFKIGFKIGCQVSFKMSFAWIKITKRLNSGVFEQAGKPLKTPRRSFCIELQEVSSKSTPVFFAFASVRTSFCWEYFSQDLHCDSQAKWSQYVGQWLFHEDDIDDGYRYWWY